MSDKPEKIIWDDKGWLEAGFVGDRQFCTIRPHVSTIYKNITNSFHLHWYDGSKSEHETLDKARSKAEELLAKWIIRADLAKPSEWISVDDRLPRDFMTIDVWIDIGEVRGRLTDFISDNRGFCEVKLGSVSPYPDQDVITHWRIPSPPDKE